MPRRAYFVFHQPYGFETKKLMWFVSMPRRAEFIFYLAIDKIATILGHGFQCPEGLNLFSIREYSGSWHKIHRAFQCPEGLNLFSIGSCTPILPNSHSMVSMPRRAEFIFYPVASIAYNVGASKGFNAPKGWIYFLSVVWTTRPRVHSTEFQCPEGLNLFSIPTWRSEPLSIREWHVSMPRRAEFIFYHRRGA